MPRWQGKSQGSPLGYRIFVWICKNLGVTPAYILLYFVAGYYFLTSWSSSRHSYYYFRHRMGFGTLRSMLKVYRNYYVFGQTILDKVIVMAGIQNAFTFHFDGVENLKAIVKNGKGGILLSAHVGNWEAAGHLLNHLNTKVNVVMYDGEHEKIKSYLTEVTGGHNFKVIVIRDSMSHVYEIGAALQKNELVCLHADRFLEGNKTSHVTFLGERAPFPIGPFQMAAGFRAPVSFVFAFKETNKHYHFFGSPHMLAAEDESKKEFADRLLNTFVDHLEQKVKRYPEQWFNYYNFWAQ